MKAAILGFVPTYRQSADSALSSTFQFAHPARSLRSALSVKSTELRLFHAWRP